MSKKATPLKEIPATQRKRFREAQKSFEELQKEIEPYIKRRELKPIAKAEEWRKTTSLHSQTSEADAS